MSEELKKDDFKIDTLNDIIVERDGYKEQCDDLQQRIDKAIEYNYIVSNSDYVYSQDEIANKNISILQGKEVK